MSSPDAAAPAGADAGEPPSLLALPRPLLAAVLLLSADGDAAGFVRCAAVCRDLRALVRGGGPWPQLTALLVASPGGRCPFSLAARAGSLQRLSVHADSGVGAGDELLVLRDAPLRQLELHGLVELSRATLLALCAPTLATLDIGKSRADAETLAAALDRCPKLRELSADSCAHGGRASHAAALFRRLRSHALTRLSLRYSCCSTLDEATLTAIALASPALAYLDVCGAEALRRVPGEVAALRHLRELHAQDCGLSNTGFAAPSDDNATFFPALTALSLSGCRGLGDAGITNLAALLHCGDDARPPLSRLRLARLLDLADAPAAALLRARPAPLLALDVRCCGRLGKAFFATCRETRFAELRASGLPRLTPAMLLALAESGALRLTRLLELDDCEALQRGGDDAAAAVAAAACAAGDSLQRLSLDGCVLQDAGAVLVADACTRLEHLSLIGVSGLGDAGLTALARGCVALRSLTVGGSRGRWSDATLSAFTSLHTLRIARRNDLYDAELADAVRGCGANLRSVALAACGGVSDASLAALAQAAPGLRSLTLTACDHRDLRGAPLRCFPRLRTLVVTSCPALECGSLVHAMVACPDLLRMHLPGWLRLQLAGRVPVRSPPDDEACSEVQPWRPQHMLHLDTTSSDY
jgi:hypothetical protein